MFIQNVWKSIVNVGDCLVGARIWDDLHIACKDGTLRSCKEIFLSYFPGPDMINKFKLVLRGWFQIPLKSTSSLELESLIGA